MSEEMITALTAACIAAAAPIFAVVVAHRRGQAKLQEVHVLVNNRLDEALLEIEELKKEREERASRTMTVEVLPVEVEGV